MKGRGFFRAFFYRLAVGFMLNSGVCGDLSFGMRCCVYIDAL